MHVRRRLAGMAALWLSLTITTAGAWAASATEFQVLSYDLKSDGVIEMPGRLYVPPSIAPGENRPLVVYFHGSGERGLDNAKQVGSNINGLFEKAKELGFYLYAPQIEGIWNAANIDIAMSMAAQAARTYAVDTSRLYVTGLSLGGAGARVAITTYRDTFAAAVPLSSGTYGEDDPTQLVGKPIWLFCGASDPGVYQSDDFVNAVRAADGQAAIADFAALGNAGSPYPYTYTYVTPNTTVDADFYNQNNLRYTRYTTGGHTTKLWTQAYREPWLYEWLFEQTNPLQQPQPGQSLLFDLGSSSSTDADSQNRVWNSTLADQEKTLATAVPFARLTDGTRTGVSLTVADAFVSVATGDQTAGTAYDSAVSQDTWTVSIDDPGTIVLDGLSAGQRYRITIFASDSDSDDGRGRMTRYTIDQDYRDLEIYNNIADQAVFESVVADASGRITLTVSVTPGSDARYGGIGALEVMAVVPEPAMLSIVAGMFLLSMRRRR